MTREEFIEMAIKAGYDLEEKITDSDWNDIQYVYTFHPSISNSNGKQQIVLLVGTFGMRIIKDMKSTAKKAEDLEEQIRQARSELETLEEDYKELRR